MQKIPIDCVQDLSPNIPFAWPNLEAFFALISSSTNTCHLMISVPNIKIIINNTVLLKQKIILASI